MTRKVIPSCFDNSWSKEIEFNFIINSYDIHIQSKFINKIEFDFFRPMVTINHQRETICGQADAHNLDTFKTNLKVVEVHWG